MKILGIILKTLLAIGLIAALVIAGIFAYMTTYGKSMLEGALSGVMGSGLKFKTVSLDIGQRAVSFKGISIASEIGLQPKVFNAEKFTLKLDKEALAQRKQCVVDEVIIEKAALNIERKPDGRIDLMAPVKEENPGFDPGGQKQEEPSGLYDLVRAVRKVTVKDSTVRFWDGMVSQEPFLVMCENVNIDMTADPGPGSASGYVKVKISSRFNIYNRPYVPGLVQLDADMKVYKPFVEASFTMTAGNIDIIHVKPYLDAYTPFVFTRGVFSANMRADIDSSNINSLTTINFHSVNVGVNPAKQDSEFLQTSVNKLVPYLTSNQGEIVFDFIVSGPIRAPVVSMGPKLKEAAGQAVMQEVGRYLQGMQSLNQ